MKYILRYSILLILIGIFAAGCSEVRTDIPATAPVVRAHKTGNLDVSSPDFHGNIVRLNNWSMKECMQCHAADYKGGNTGAGCFKCHTSEKGPEACNTCHGDFKNASRIAPPRDTKGNYDNTAGGVGAHQNHLYTNTLGKKVRCSNCHIFPTSLEAPGHIDSPLPAEINFKGLADTNIAVNAKFDPATLTCSNVYCHGNFEFKKADAEPTNQFAYSADKMTGNNFSPVWNKVDGTQAECGTCHGLPPTGHIPAPITACYLCHQGVVDEMGNIIDKDKHINGYKSARGSLNKLQEFLEKIK